MRPRRLLIPALALLAACSGKPGQTSAQPLQGGFGAPDRRPPADAADLRVSFSPVVKKAAPAVVNVYARRVVRQQVDPFWQMFGRGVPRERVQQSLGSGAIVRADGVIVTNNHVVEGGEEIMVVLSDRREFPARVLVADPRSDLAVLQIDARGERLPVIAIDDADSLEVGDLVLAIGNPFGVGQTVTNGIISALARTGGGAVSGDNSYYIQTDAPINPGNSGGPLVDMDGDLIGVNSAILSRTGTSTGVGFAVPAAMVRQVVATAVGGGTRVIRPWLGVRGQSVTGEIASSLGLERPNGVLVAGVYPGGAAAKAGIREGDIVLSVDGQPVDDEAALNFRVGTHNAGDRMTLQVRRGAGPIRTVAVRAEAPPGGSDERTIAGRNPLGGAKVTTLSPAVAEDLGVDPFAARGVLVTSVASESLAEGTGVRRGDIVVAVNGRPIATTGELQSALGSGARTWRITIQRGSQQITGSFSL